MSTMNDHQGDGRRILSFFQCSKGPKGTTLTWTCAIPGCFVARQGCAGSGTGITRLIDHVLREHADNDSAIAAVYEWARSPHANNKRSIHHITTRVHEARNKKHKAVRGPSFTCPPVELEAPGLSPKDVLNREASRLIIINNLSLGHFDNPENQKFLDCVAWVCRHSPPETQISSLLQSRKVLTEKWIPEMAQEMFDEVASSLRRRAQISGCSLLQDGRSNTNHDALLVFGVEVQGSYLFLGFVDCKERQKDAEFLTRVTTEFVTEEAHSAGFGGCVIACVTDGAASCKLSAVQLCETLDILPVRCQLHAMNLAIKHVFRLVPLCHEVENKANSVIDLFLSNGRLRALLKKHSQNKVLLRFVPVRMAIHVLALRRLQLLRPYLLESLFDPQFQSYVDAQDSAKRERCIEVANIVKDEQFWKGVRFCVEALTPLLVTLRIFDQASCMAGFVHFLWALLRESVCCVFGNKAHDWVPIDTKQLILDSIEDDFVKECSHAFDAAYVLNPVFYDRVCGLASSREPEDQLEWQDLHKSTSDVLAIVLRRDLRVRGKLSTFDAEFKKVTKEFQQYYRHKDIFASIKAAAAEDDVELWWDTNGAGTGLKFYAIWILGLAHCVSNVERNHKLMSLIHTTTRNRLRPMVVDMLTKGRLAFKTQQFAQKFKFSVSRTTMVRAQDLTFLTELTPDEEADLERWGDQLGQTSRVDQQTPVTFDQQNSDNNCDQDDPAAVESGHQQESESEGECDTQVSVRTTKSGRKSQMPRWRQLGM